MSELLPFIIPCPRWFARCIRRKGRPEQKKKPPAQVVDSSRSPCHCEERSDVAIRSLAMLGTAPLYKRQGSGFPRQCAHWLGMTRKDRCTSEKSLPCVKGGGCAKRNRRDCTVSIWHNPPVKNRRFLPALPGPRPFCPLCGHFPRWRGNLPFTQGGLFGVPSRGRGGRKAFRLPVSSRAERSEVERSSHRITAGHFVNAKILRLRLRLRSG